MPPNTSPGPLPWVCSPEPSAEEAQGWGGGTEKRLLSEPHLDSPPQASGAGSAEQRQDQSAVCVGTGARWSGTGRGLPGNCHTHLAESLLPGVEEPQVPIFTLCRLLSCFCSGQQEGTVSFMEHWYRRGCIHRSRGKTPGPMSLGCVLRTGAAQFSRWLRDGGQ